MKVRLDLTVQQRFKDMAREMARKRRRSISGLFEDLIEQEKSRETQKKIWPIHTRHVLRPLSAALAVPPVF
jgi:hypothetical protein